MAGDNGRSGQNRAPRTPNRVLRAIRENERHETRAQFAEALTRVALETDEKLYPDEKYVERLESGSITWPGPSYRNILTNLLDRPITELGFTAPIRSREDTPILNEALRDAILASGLEVPQLARKVGVDPKTVQRWVTKGRVPHPGERWKACQILKRSESELWPNAVPKEEHPRLPQAEPTAEIFSGALQVELLRQEMNEIFRSSMNDASLEEWEHISVRYAKATRDRAAGVLLEDLSQDLSELSHLMRNQRNASALRRLTRVSAQMSGLMCLIFCLLDDRKSFRKWARTASLAGNESGDSEILSWVLAQEAYGHYYSGDISEAIDVARHANEIVRVPCTGAALASALEARAYAAIGRDTETRDSLARAERILSRLDGDALIPSAFGYNEASFRFHEGNAYTRLGDFKLAMRAQDRALELCPPDNYADWAMTRFDRAQCLIYSGEVSGGLEFASETIKTLMPAKRQGIFVLRGQEILNSIPEAGKKVTEARDFRELLAAAQNKEA